MLLVLLSLLLTQACIMLSSKDDIVNRLQQDICRLEGFKPGSNFAVDIELGSLKDAFPNASFPLGAVHEFLSNESVASPATSGFITAVLSGLMGSGGISLWISSSRTLFPPALKNFGLSPDQFIFIDLQKEKDIIYTMEEALKCGALTAVVGEMREISFTASRRLQLAVEKSQVTGFIIRKHSGKPNTTACVSRWKISSLQSDDVDGLPGIGFPQWKVELLRIRNGRSGLWHVRWENGQLKSVHKPIPVVEEQRKKTG
jgi:protein ImuA